jgi:hypothetical protein
MPVYPPAAQMPQAPQKKKSGIIIAVVIVVILVCLAMVIGAGVLFRAAAVSYYSEEPVEIVLPDNNSGNTGTTDNFDNSDGSGGKAAPIVNGEVLVDNDILTIIVDVENGSVDEYVSDWYSVPCMVENKTNKPLGMYFDMDTSFDGVKKGDVNTMIMPDEEMDFLPETELAGTIVFFTLPPEGQVTNLKGTLIVFDTETYETIGEYPISMAKL